MLALNKSNKKVGSRRQIRIKEVKDNILILPNNQYRLVLETSSINFELKSEEEQDVIIDSFQNFLNSLPSSLQILIRVREMDIDSYTQQIQIKGTEEKEAIYREQIDTYCTFIKQMVRGNKILSRRFYVIVPFNNTGKNDFTTIKEHLYLERDIVSKGIEKLGMKARQLTSLELLDLFYSFYNPDQIKTQALKGQTIDMLLKTSYV